MTQREADAALALLLELGVNHIDTAASYGDSELRLRLAREHRADFFLATKTGERTYAAAPTRSAVRSSVWASTRSTSSNCTTSSTPIEWELALGEGGALRSGGRGARGGTGALHRCDGPRFTIAAMHRRSLERFAFDSVLLPYNYVMMQDAAYAADVRGLLAVCRERNVAVQTIKGITRAPWGPGRRRRPGTSP